MRTPRLMRGASRARDESAASSSSPSLFASSSSSSSSSTSSSVWMRARVTSVAIIECVDVSVRCGGGGGDDDDDDDGRGGANGHAPHS